MGTRKVGPGRRPTRALAHALATAVALMTVAGGLGGCTRVDRHGSVTVMALWSGSEEAAFRQVLDQFERRTGITVRYTGGREIPTAVAQAVNKGDPPDVAVLSDPATVRSYVQRGKLKPLDTVLDTRRLGEQYPTSWLEVMRVGTGLPHAVVVKANVKSLVWYNPQTFRAHGYTPPRTWAQLEALTRAAASDGIPAWCLGLESTSTSGWPGTDWIEDILLHESGPETYRRWIDGELSWTSPQVRSAWQRWGRLITGAGAVNGGRSSALVTHYGNAGAPMFDTTPGCLMDHQASFIASRYTALTRADGRPVQPGTDFDVFAFPRIDDRYAGALEVGADLAGTFTDTPQARALLAFLASPQAQRIWPELPGSGVLSVNTAVPLSVYPDPIATRLARMVTGRSASGATVPPTLVFDASDLMPAQLTAAFHQAVLAYVAAPERLDELLHALDRIRLRAYR